MIEVKTTDNGAKYCFEPDRTTLEVMEKNEGLGAVSLSVDSGKHILFIHALKCTDALISDFLVRSAAAYGDNRYCTDIVCLDTDNRPVYEALGFVEKGGQLVLPVGNIVHKTLNRN